MIESYNTFGVDDDEALDIAEADEGMECGEEEGEEHDGEVEVMLACL